MLPTAHNTLGMNSTVKDDNNLFNSNAMQQNSLIRTAVFPHMNSVKSSISLERSIFQSKQQLMEMYEELGGSSKQNDSKVFNDIGNKTKEHLSFAVDSMKENA